MHHVMQRAPRLVSTFPRLKGHFAPLHSSSLSLLFVGLPGETEFDPMSRGGGGEITTHKLKRH
jgi:hypothetical protein